MFFEALKRCTKQENVALSNKIGGELNEKSIEEKDKKDGFDWKFW